MFAIIEIHPHEFIIMSYNKMGNILNDNEKIFELSSRRGGCRININSIE